MLSSRLSPARDGAKTIVDWIDKVKKLVLDKDKIDPSRHLFKLKSFYDCVVVRRDLADAISKQGFTGIKWVECEKYKS